MYPLTCFVVAEHFSSPDYIYLVFSICGSYQANSTGKKTEADKTSIYYFMDNAFKLGYVMFELTLRNGNAKEDGFVFVCV